MALLFLFAASPALAFSGADYVPLEVGNFWTYDEDGTTITNTVTDVNDVGGRDVFDLTRTGGDQDGVVQLRSSDGDGVQIFGERAPFMGSTLIVDYDPPILELPASFDVGDQWERSGDADFVVLSGGSGTLPYTAEGRFIGIEPVSVPFGTFPDALKFEFTIDIDGTVVVTNEWFVEDLGPVKGVGIFGESFTAELIATNVPEPGTALLLAGGLAALAAARPRR